MYNIYSQSTYVDVLIIVVDLEGAQAVELYLQCYQLVLWKQAYWLVHNKGYPPELEVSVHHPLAGYLALPTPVRSLLCISCSLSKHIITVTEHFRLSVRWQAEILCIYKF